MNESEDLIDRLVEELKPMPDRSRLGPPLLGWGAAFAILVLACLAVASVLAPERSWIASVMEPAFFLALIPAVPACAWAISLSLPGRPTGRWVGLTIFFFLLWGLYLFIDILGHTRIEQWFNLQGRFCILDILVIAVLPLFFLINIIRRRFVMDRDSAVVALFLSSSLVGAACAGIICKDHSSLHVFQEHFLPVGGLLAGIYAVRRLRSVR